MNEPKQHDFETVQIDNFSGTKVVVCKKCGKKEFISMDSELETECKAK